jgi:hypothetical protein
VIYSKHTARDSLSAAQEYTMVKDYEIKTALEKVAKDMHTFDPNPITWLNWLTYLLNQLEDQSRDVNPSNHQRYLDMITSLKDAIYNRQQTGSW